MMKIKKKMKLVAFLVLLSLLFGMIFYQKSYAAFEINQAELYSKGDCGSLLKKDGRIIHVTYVVYNKNGKEYPAYCLDKAKPGVGEVGNYTVSIDETLKNPKVWRAIINGFPYKTPTQLGCVTEQEAFTATKMAVYSVLYDYSISQFSSIGEAGERTLIALDMILEAARSGSQTKPSSALTIEAVNSEWKIDEQNTNYMYQLYQVKANGPMQNYTIELEKENAQVDAIITDVNHNERKQFDSKESFKVLVPISQLGEGGSLTITAKAQVETKPILIGKSPVASQQDYAITGIMLEEGMGSKTVHYTKNQTKLKILKKDQDQDIPLAGAYFDLYDEEDRQVLTDLVSNENGEIIIDNLLPGTYYLKETKAPDGYLCYEGKIEIQVGLNEELTVIVKDKKEEEPTIEIEKVKKEVKQETTSLKLPKTGM